MTSITSRRWAFLSGMLTLVACWGINWFVSGAAVATIGRQAAVGAQVLVSGVLALWCWRRSASVGTKAGQHAPAV
jgi:hypothetical protein